MGQAERPDGLPHQHGPLVRYLAYRDKRECGPSVPDAVRATVLWMHKRLEMEAPDTKADLPLAIRDKAVQERGKETSEQHLSRSG